MRNVLITLYTFIIALLSACAPVHIDPAFEPYYKQLEVRWNRNVHDVPIQFGDMPNEQTAGFCNGSITISKPFWDNTTDDVRLMLVAHELGHCEFHLKHDERKLADFCPATVMYPYAFGNPCLANHNEEFDINNEGQ